MGIASAYSSARESAAIQQKQTEAIKKLQQEQAEGGILEVNKTQQTLQDNSRKARTLSSLRIGMLPQAQDKEEVTRNAYGVDTNQVATATQNMMGLRPLQYAMLAQYEDIKNHDIGTGSYSEGTTGKLNNIQVIKTNHLSIPKTDSEYVFINPRTQTAFGEAGMEKEWNKIKEKAGINDFRFHDLRHTVGTRLAQKGVPVPVIKDIMAHSDIKTTMRYVHTAEEQMLKAMEVLNSYN